MRIASGDTTRKLAFMAYDTSGSPVTGLSSFTVYQSRNGGTPAAFTTPTIAEADATNMPGLYWLTVDEATTMTGGSETEELTLRITASGMVAVVRAIELYVATAIRRGIAQAGSGSSITLDASASSVSQFYQYCGVRIVDGTGAGQMRVISGYTNTTKVASVSPSWSTSPDNTSVFEIIPLSVLKSDVVRWLGQSVPSPTTSGVPQVEVVDIDASGQTDIRSAVGLGSANIDTQLATIAAYIDTEVAAIKAKTDNLPSDPADASDIAAAFSALQSHGDSNWTTATGFSTLTANDVRVELAPELESIGDLYLIHGLDSSNPLTVTPTSREAGTIAQTISGDGETSTTVTRTA